MSFKTVNALFLSFLSAENLQTLCGDLSEESLSGVLAAWKEQEGKLKKLWKNEKPKKGSTHPKKNMSGYLFFCRETRPSVKEENPDMKAHEIMTELGARWKIFKETEDVKRYEILAAKDKERYLAEMEDYVPSDEEEKPKEKKTRSNKDSTHPKKNMSGYLFFCREERPIVKKEIPDIKSGDVMVELGARWNELKTENPEKVKEYMEMAAEDKERYLEEMKNYVPSDEEEKPKEKKSRAKKAAKVEEVEEKSKETRTKETKKEEFEEEFEEDEKEENQKSSRSKEDEEKPDGMTEEEEYFYNVEKVIREVIEKSDGTITVKIVKKALQEKGLKVPDNLKSLIKNI